MHHIVTCWHAIFCAWGHYPCCCCCLLEKMYQSITCHFPALIQSPTSSGLLYIIWSWGAGGISSTSFEMEFLCVPNITVQLVGSIWCDSIGVVSPSHCVSRYRNLLHLSKNIGTSQSLHRGNTILLQSCSLKTTCCIQLDNVYPGGFKLYDVTCWLICWRPLVESEP